VRIDDPELAAEEARTWVRGGHLMVHKMTRLSVIAADGTSGGWMILEPGDTFTIGDHVFEFRILDPAVRGLAIAQDAVPAEESTPNVLRDPSAQGEPPRVSDHVTAFPLADMVPSSELAPSSSYDDDE